MYRCFIDQDLKLGQDIIVDEYNHIVKSLRMIQGDQLELAGPGGVFLATIVSTDKDLLVRVDKPLDRTSESPIKISLYQALVKGDKFDHIVQKAVELGVHEIIPVETTRSVVRLDEKRKTKKIQRYQAIAMAAAKQSRREYIPRIKDMVDIKDIPPKNLYIAYEEEGRGLKEAFKELKDEEISILIGPEGGLEDWEVEGLKDQGARVINFGNRILRTETAGLFLISALQYELGDMG